MTVTTEQFGIISTWTDEESEWPAEPGVVRWVSSYREHENLELEQKRLLERAVNLAKLFEKRRMPNPTVRILDGLDALSPKVLKVSSIYAPDVNTDTLGMFAKLGISPLTPEQAYEGAQKELIRKGMLVGAYSIRDVYGSDIVSGEERG